MTQPTPASNRIADGVSADSSTAGPKQDCPPVPKVPDHDLLRLIGSGSYGDVWLARNITNALWAIKIIYRHRFDDTRPFEREFNGIQRFEPISRTHPCQVAILHIGKNDADGYFYYVMELADDASDDTRNLPSHSAENPAFSSRQPPGSIESYVPKTLKWELKTRSRLPFDRCLRIGLSLTTALAHLHHHGLIHRDIKPSNIIFVGGLPKLADIGLVSWIDATRSFVGTEGFVPPEGSGSPEADIYSLGKVLYEISTGRDRQEFPELPTALREIEDCEGLVELNEIILKACESDPSKRYRSAEEMHADLALLQAGKSVRRARSLEKHLRALKRFAMGAIAIVGITAAAWFYQQHQTRQAQFWAEQSRERLVRLYTAQATQRIDEGNLLGSLPWLAEALLLDQGKSAEQTHRVRLGITLRQSPSLEAYWQRPEPFRLIDISPDQHMLLSAHQNTAHILDVETGSPLGAPLKHEAKVLSASFSPQGDRIFTSTQTGVATVWDVATRSPLSSQRTDKLTLNLSIFSSDGKVIVTAAHDQTQDRHYAWAWDARSGIALSPQLPADGVIRQLCISSSGNYLAVESQPALCPELTLWDLRSGQKLWSVGTYHDQANVLRFSPDGRWLYTGHATGALKRWDIRQGTVEQILDLDALILSLCFSHDGKRLAIGTGFHSGLGRGTASVNDLQTGKPVGPPMPHPRVVQSVAFSPDDRYLLTTSDDSSVRVWHPKTGRLAIAPLPHEGKLRHVAFAQGGRCLLSVTDHSVRLWNISPSSPSIQFLSDHDQMGVSAVSPDGRYAAATAADHTPQIWDITAKTRFRPNPQIAYGISSFAFSSDSKLLAAAVDDKSVSVWQLHSGKIIEPTLAHPAPVERVLFHPDNQKIAAVSGRNIHVWNAVSGQPLRPPVSLPSPVRTLAWSANGKTLIIACIQENESQLFQASLDTETAIPYGKRWTGEIIHILPAENQLLLAIAENDFTVRIWDADAGDPITPPLIQDAKASDFIANSTLTKAAVLSNRGTLRLWHLPSGDPIGPPLKHPNVALHASLSPDESSIVVAGSEGAARVWDCSPDPRPAPHLQALARLLSSREFDAITASVPATPARLAEAWAQLGSVSALPKPSTHQTAQWHRHQADLCERERIWNPNADNWEAARFHRSRAIELEPQSAADWLARALAHLHLNQWAQAKADYQTALVLGAQLSPSTSDHLMLQLVTGDLDGYRRSCLEMLHRARSIPSSPGANGAVWFACLVPNAVPDYTAPTQMIRQLIERQPNVNSFWNTLGAILYRAGLHEQSVQALEQAKLCTPDKEGTPFDALFLAMAHHALGNAQQAQACLEKATRVIETPDPGRIWKWQVELTLLRQQAETLILNSR